MNFAMNIPQFFISICLIGRGEKQLTVLSSHLLSIKKLRPFELNLL